MARQPSEWTIRDWALVCHALLRTRWQGDLDDEHALELCREIGETKGVPVRDLLEAGPPPESTFCEDSEYLRR